MVIVAGHYPLSYPLGGPSASLNHQLPLRGRLATALEEAGATLYLHGHAHERWVCPARSGSPLLCVNAGSAGLQSDHPKKAAGFVEITIGEGRVNRVQAFHLSSPDKTLETHDFPFHDAEGAASGA